MAEHEHEIESSERIAIVGMNGRFPGAATVDEFWRNLRDGVESIRFFSEAELAASSVDADLLNNRQYVNADGVIDNMDLFDAEFFNFTPREAELLDPQHRLLLECAWELMESSGYDAEWYPGRVGVFASANLSSYLIRNIMANAALRGSATSFQTMLANDKDFIATRISHLLNFSGPSINVATLCSSSFVAIHLACRSLLSYECDLALAGAASLQVSRHESLFYQEGGIGDPDGHCRAFDSNARGTVSGSGLGLVLLKRLEDALSEGDTIHAVILGSAVNNDGANKISYTAPSVEGQAEVVSEAMAMADVDPETITYVEAHGTGTLLGDPIEVEALTKAFREKTNKRAYCRIGSVKTNIGHLVNAGGVASLIKTVLALQHRQIPASLNFQTPNPKIDFAASPFFVNTHLTDWDARHGPRRAGVSSFGIGGTNVHLVVEEAPEPAPTEATQAPQILVLSARTPSALEAYTDRLVAHLESAPNANLADIAYTLQIGRRAFEHRRAVVCSSVAEAERALRTRDSGCVETRSEPTKRRPVVLFVPELQDVTRASALEALREEPVFSEQVQRCATVVRSRGRDLALSSSPIDATTAFVFSYALAKQLEAWGIKPHAVGGEGVGHVVAGCLAGILSLSDALSIVGDGASSGQPALKPELRAPDLPVLSGMERAWMNEAEALDPNTWTRPPGPASTARFAHLGQESGHVILSLGLTDDLSSDVKALVTAADGPSVVCMNDGASAREGLAGVLARLWLHGVQVNWTAVHGETLRRRVPLPTYPFERRRYWVEPDASGADLLAHGAQDTPSTHLQPRPPSEWRYLPSWRRTLWPAPMTEQRGLPVRWAIFTDDRGIGGGVAERLRRRGDEVMLVHRGERFSPPCDDEMTIVPDRPADYEALVSSLFTRDDQLVRIVHLWGTNAVKTTEASPLDESSALDEGFYSLVSLLRPLAARVTNRPLPLTVVMEAIAEVNDSDDLAPGKAAVIGLLRVMQQELPGLDCRTIDVKRQGRSATDIDTLTDRLLADLLASSEDREIAYRGLHRWVRHFENVPMNPPVAPASAFREGGVYLIFDGLMGVGLSVAEHLARDHHAKLVVTEDDGADPDGKITDSLLALGASDAIALRAQSGQAAQVRRAVALTYERYGHIDGVIFASVVSRAVDLRAICDLDRTACADALAAALDGPRALAAALDDHQASPPEFCLMLSSLASVLGGVGSAVYAAASCALDAFVHNASSTRRAGCRWVGVSTDPWRAVDATLLNGTREEPTIPTQEGLLLIDQVLASFDAGQLIASPVDLAARMSRWLTPQSPSSDEDPDSSRPASAKLHARPSINEPFLEPRSAVERGIADIWQDLMGIDRIGVNDDFFELGGHSLLAVQIMGRVRRAFSVEVPLEDLFERPTVANLADYIETQRWAAERSDKGPPPTAGTEDRDELEI